MTDVQEVTFSEALGASEHLRRNILLGNGFSISGWPRFDYSSLVDQARSTDPGFRALFSELGATNFEDALAAAGDDEEASDIIRRAFVNAVAAIHPRRDEAFYRHQRAACADFLMNFLRTGKDPRRGNIFTTNYDALLYWVLVEHRERLSSPYDGFKPQRYIWSSAALDRAAVFYLHGALHIYEERARWGGPIFVKGIVGSDHENLIAYIRAQLRGGHFPVMVAEGSAEQKRQKMNSKEYLQDVGGYFRAECRAPKRALFTVGHSLAAVDSHIIDAIGLGSVEQVYLGVFGGQAQPRAKEVVSAWKVQRAERGLPPLQVQLFDTTQLRIWGDPTLT